MTPEDRATPEGGWSLEVAELLVASAFFHGEAKAFEALRQAAERVSDWTDAIEAWERHGTLLLALRNLKAAKIPIPAGAADLANERARVLQDDLARDALSCQEFLSVARERSLETVLLKGAALSRTLYRSFPWRSQGDVDVLLPKPQLGEAIAGVGARGWELHGDRFPVWWYRLSHFHLKMHPRISFLKEIELHWALHSPVLGAEVSLAKLWERSRVLESADSGFDDEPAESSRILDPLDSFFHHLTHLISHWYGNPGPPCRETWVQIAREPLPEVRLKWWVDLREEARLLAAEGSREELLARSREWGAEKELAWFTGTLLDVPDLDDSVRAWWQPVAETLPQPLTREAREYRSTRPNPSSQESGHAPLRGLDFRLGVLRRIPGWIWPVGNRRPFLARFVHALRTTATLVVWTLALPIALTGRAIRRQPKEARLAPDEVMRLAASHRRLARSWTD